VTPIASGADRVLLDTSVFINFAEAGALFQLAKYLGDRASIVVDVDSEIRRNATGRFPALKTLPLLGWPEGEPLALPPRLLEDAKGLRRLHRQPGQHADSNSGEIATVLMATQLEGVVALVDDRLGKQLCRMRGIPRLSSAQLVIEMMVAEALDEETALRAFDIATPPDVGEPEFQDAVTRSREQAC